MFNYKPILSNHLFWVNNKLFFFFYSPTLIHASQLLTKLLVSGISPNNTMSG